VQETACGMDAEDQAVSADGETHRDGRRSTGISLSPQRHRDSSHIDQRLRRPS
jgi:hypothetical protein